MSDKMTMLLEVIDCILKGYTEQYPELAVDLVTKQDEFGRSAMIWVHEYPER